MKKDILAAFTFLATAFVFYVVQTENPEDGFFSQPECGVETSWQEGDGSQQDITLDIEDVSRDS